MRRTGSLAWWWQIRPGETPALVECKASKLATARAQCVGVCIVDTAPHDKVGIDQAIRVANLVLIPTRPGPFDLAAVDRTPKIVERVGKPALTVLNACPPRTGAAEPSIVTEPARPVNSVRGIASPFRHRKLLDQTLR